MKVLIVKVTHSVEEPIRDPNSINLRMQNHLHSSGRGLGRMHANPAKGEGCRVPRYAVQGHSQD